MTVEYTDGIKSEFDKNNKTVGDVITLWRTYSGDCGNDVLEQEYCSAEIVEVKENSISFKLKFPENVQSFLDKLADGFIFFKGEPDKSTISLSSEIESQFDLTQEKIWHNPSLNADFTDNEIIICFKKTITYPELSIEVFNFENAESIDYIMLSPSGGSSDKYTQIAVIRLKEKGREKVLEAIRYFERISIIACAQPNHLDNCFG